LLEIHGNERCEEVSSREWEQIHKKSASSEPSYIFRFHWSLLSNMMLILPLALHCIQLFGLMLLASI